MNSGLRRLADLRREASAAARELQGGEQTLSPRSRPSRPRTSASPTATTRGALARACTRGARRLQRRPLRRRPAAGRRRGARLGLDGAETADVHSAALLHDIGKIGVPDHVLTSPAGSTRTSGRCCASTRRSASASCAAARPSTRSRPACARARALGRHGYPDGLAARRSRCPRGSCWRCDAWHALVSTAPTARALPDAEARGRARTLRRHPVRPARLSAARLSRRARATPQPPLLSARQHRRRRRALERELRILLPLSAGGRGRRARSRSCSTSPPTRRARALGADVGLRLALGVAGRDPAHAGQRRASWRRARRATRATRSTGSRATTRSSGCCSRALLRRRRRRPACTRSSARCSSGSGGARALAVPIMLGDAAWGELWATRAATTSPTSASATCGCSTRSRARSRPAIARAELYGRMAELALPGRADRPRQPARARGAARGRRSSAERGGEEVTLLLCDVDNLKALNEGRGHHGGDWALKAVAGALRTAAEALPTRSCAGISGDEFGDPRRGRERRGRAARGRARDRAPGGHRPPVRLSCGIASTPLGLRSASELLRAADAALYTAKRTGRGRVCSPTSTRRPPGARPAARAPAARRRDGLEVDTGALITQGARLLDGPLRAAPPLERLEGLATSLGATLRAVRGRGLAVHARRRRNRDAVRARPALRPLLGRAPGRRRRALRARRVPAHGRAARRRRVAAPLRGRRRTPTPPSARCSAGWG